VHEDRALVVTVPRPVPGRVFVAACAIAGALAVPVDAVATPVSTLVAGLVGFLGLRLWRWSGLPGSLKTEAPAGFERVVRPAASLGLGLIVGLLLLGVIRLVIEPAVPAAGARIAAAAALPIWRRVVIIYVAAVGEEIVFRLLLLSVVTGLTMRLLRRSARTPNGGVVWGAIGLSAFAFAAVHLPAWSALGPVSPGLALMVMTLNGLGGVVFGWVFVTRGIVAAIWAHAGADCAIQLIGPLT
jgi:CAAX prenyl protease-like protein